MSPHPSSVAIAKLFKKRFGKLCKTFTLKPTKESKQLDKDLQKFIAEGKNESSQSASSL